MRPQMLESTGILVPNEVANAGLYMDPKRNESQHGVYQHFFLKIRNPETPFIKCAEIRRRDLMAICWSMIGPICSHGSCPIDAGQDATVTMINTDQKIFVELLNCALHFAT